MHADAASATARVTMPMEMLPPAGRRESTTPAVDVAIPSYQYGRYLRTCVESVLSQDVAVRVLIIDNASTDNSVEVAEQLAADDSRVEVLARPRNLGPHASFNEGVDWASAPYFMILCADDYLVPGALGRAVAIMEEHPSVGLAYGRAKPLFEDGPSAPGLRTDRPARWTVERGEVVLRRFCRTTACPILNCATVVRTEVQREVGHYRPSLPHTDDLELWMRFACRADVARTDAVQGIVRVHRHALSSPVRDRNVLALGYIKDAFDSFFAHEGAVLTEAERLRRTATRSLAGRAYWSGLSHLVRGDVAEGQALRRVARELDPWTRFIPPLDSLVQRGDAWKRVRWLAQQLGRRRPMARAHASPPS